MTRRLSALVVLAACLLMACAPVPPLPDGYTRQQQVIDGVEITLDSLKDPQVNQTQPFRISLRDRDGRLIDEATVTLDLEMNMICLSGAKPIATRIGRGQYEALSVYQMPGDWHVTVISEIAATEYRATFVINVN